MGQKQRLPRAVEEAGKKSDKLIQEAQNAGKPAATENQVPTPTPVAQKVEEVTPGVKTDDPPKDDYQKLYTELQHKHEVLQGKYNSEVPRLHADKRELTAQVDSLKAEIGTLQKQLDAKPPVEVKPVNDEHLKKLGENLGTEHDIYLAMSEQNKVITEQRETIEKLHTTLKTMEGKVSNIETDVSQANQVASKTVSDRFYDDLTKEVSDWEKINPTPEFHEWLGEIDDMAGETRQTLLERAHAARNVKRVSTIFKKFIEYRDSKPKPAAKKTLDKNIEHLAQPSNATGNASPTEGRIWTRVEINKFYVDSARGKYSKEEALELETDILKAQSEGRVK